MEVKWGLTPIGIKLANVKDIIQIKVEKKEQVAQAFSKSPLSKTSNEISVTFTYNMVQIQI